MTQVTGIGQIGRRTSKRGARMFLVVSLAVLIAILALTVFRPIPLDTALLLQELKSEALAFFVFGMMIFHLLTGLPIRRNTVLCSSGLFVFWLFIAQLSWKTDPHFPTVLLATVWLLVNALISQGWLCTIPFTVAARTMAVGMALILVSGMLTYFFFGRAFDTFNSSMQNRISFGFENPNFFAQVPVALMFCVAFLKAHSGRELKTAVAVLVAISTAVAIATVSRSNFVATLVFAVYIFMPSRSIRYALGFAIVFLMIPSFLFLQYEQLNQISSGRVMIWGHVLSSAFSDSAWSFVFGSRVPPDLGDVVHQYSRLQQYSELATTTFFRADNIFVQLMIDGGLVLVALYLVVLRTLFKQSKKLPRRLRIVWRAAFVSIIVQGFFISNQFSFFAPVSLFAFLFLMFPLHFRAADPAH